MQVSVLLMMCRPKPLHNKSTLRKDHKKTILSPLKVWSITMRYSSQVKPISYLKANAAEVLTQLGEKREPMIITQNGEAKAVLQDVTSFEETQETLALLKILALGNQDVANQKTSRIDRRKKFLGQILCCNQLQLIAKPSPRFYPRINK